MTDAAEVTEGSQALECETGTQNQRILGWWRLSSLQKEETRLDPNWVRLTDQSHANRTAVWQCAAPTRFERSAISNVFSICDTYMAT